MGVKPSKAIGFLGKTESKRLTIEPVADDDTRRILDVVQLDGRDRRIHALERRDNALAYFEVLQVGDNILDGIEEIRRVISKPRGPLSPPARCKELCRRRRSSRFPRSGL